MTTLAASDSPQLYVPAEQDYAWFTMPMLLWALAILTFLAVASVGMCVALVRRLNRVEDDHDTRIASAYLDAKKTAKEVAQLARDVAEIDEDVALLFNAAHDHPADQEAPPDAGGPATAPIEEVVTESVDRVIAEAPTTEWAGIVQRDIGGRTFTFLAEA